MVSGTDNKIAFSFIIFFICNAIILLVAFFFDSRKDNIALFISLLILLASLFLPTLISKKRKRIYLIIAIMLVGFIKSLFSEDGDVSGMFLISFGIVLYLRRYKINLLSIMIIVFISTIFYTVNMYLFNMRLTTVANYLLFTGFTTIIFINAFGIKQKIKPSNVTDKEVLYIKLLTIHELTYQEISSKMNVSESNVKQTFTRIRKKANAKSNTGLAVWAKESGII